MTTIPEAVLVSRWGSDHWSTFAYLETRIVDYKGVPDREHMRCEVRLHPQFGNSANRHFPGPASPTRLRCDETIDLHDDWSCLDDAEAAGLIESRGTGLHRVYALTPEGQKIAAALRAHKAADGSFATFTPPADFVAARKKEARR